MTATKENNAIMHTQIHGDQEGNYCHAVSYTWEPYEPALVFFLFCPGRYNNLQDSQLLLPCARVAKRQNYGGFVAIHLFPLIMPTNTKIILGSKRSIECKNWPYEHFLDFAYKKYIFYKPVTLVAAWGDNAVIRESGQDKRIMYAAANYWHSQLYCFGRTRDGSPQMPVFYSPNARMRVYDTWEYLQANE